MTPYSLARRDAVTPDTHLEEGLMRRRVAVAVVVIVILVIAVVTNPSQQAFNLWFAAHGEVPMTPYAGGITPYAGGAGSWAHFSVDSSNLRVFSVFRVSSSGITTTYVGALGTFLTVP